MLCAGRDEAVDVAATEGSATERRPLIIEPTHGWASLRLRDVWEYRELLYFLVWRDVKVRYKQTVLGVAWVVLQPVISVLIYTVLFGRLLAVPTGDVPYPVFACVALLPWNYFAASLTRSSTSLVGSAHLITKVYFPRLVIPISGVLSGLVDFAVAFLVLIALMIYYGIMPTLATLLLPAFLLLALVTALGFGMWLSALNVQYRDVRYVVPFLTQFWLFATPIAYPSTLLPQPWRTFYALNPMVGVVEGFRWALLGTGTTSLPLVVMSSLAALVLLVSGAFYFRRMERTFADVV